MDTKHAVTIVVLAAAVGLGSACRRRATEAPSTPAGPPPWALVYERTVAGNQDLYVMPSSGGVERRLTDDPAGDALPRWSRDGRAIVFSSNRTGNWQVYEMAAAGGEARRVRSSAATEWQADPAPDGARMAFLSSVTGAESLWVLDRRTGSARVLVRHERDSILGNPHWSPDGRSIVFSSNVGLGHQIYVAEEQTGNTRRISGLVSGGCEPRFRPDGKAVAFVSRGHHRPTSRILEHDIGSGRERVLVDWPALNYDPVYSPDGSELAFVSDVAGENAVYRVRLSDGQAWRVTFGPGPARHPDYRPA